MLQVVQLSDGQYAIRNTITGILCGNDRKTYTFRTKFFAFWKMGRITKHFNKVISKL